MADDMPGELAEDRQMQCRLMFLSGLGYEDVAVKLQLPVCLVRTVMFPEATL